MSEEEKKKKAPAHKTMRCHSCEITLYTFMRFCPHCVGALEEIEANASSEYSGTLADPYDYTQ